MLTYHGWGGNHLLSPFHPLYLMGGYSFVPLVNDKGCDSPEPLNPGRTFETRVGLDFPEAIGLLTSVDRGSSAPVFSGDRLGPDLALIPPSDLFIWVLAHLVFGKDMVLRVSGVDSTASSGGAKGPFAVPSRQDVAMFCSVGL